MVPGGPLFGIRFRVSEGRTVSEVKTSFGAAITSYTPAATSGRLTIPEKRPFASVGKEPRNWLGVVIKYNSTVEFGVNPYPEKRILPPVITEAGVAKNSPIGSA